MTVVLIFLFDIALCEKFGCDDGVMLFQLWESGGHVLPSLLQLIEIMYFPGTAVSDMAPVY